MKTRQELALQLYSRGWRLNAGCGQGCYHPVALKDGAVQSQEVGTWMVIFTLSSLTLVISPLTCHRY